MFIPDMIHQVVELLKENDRYWFMQPLIDNHMTPYVVHTSG